MTGDGSGLVDSAVGTPAIPGMVLQGVETEPGRYGGLLPNSADCASAP